MLAIYETVNRRLTRADEIEEGTWICLTAPSQEEIREVAATLDIEPADVQAALDPVMKTLFIRKKICNDP